MPIDRIASVRSEHPALVIAVADGTTPAPRWHAFRLAQDGFGGALQASILSPLAGGGATSQPLSWQGEPRTLAEWGATDAQALRELLGQACQSLASQALQAGEAMWRRH